MPSYSLPLLSASLSLMLRNLIVLLSANFAIRALILLIVGIRAVLPLVLRGVRPISRILALGACLWRAFRQALMPLVTSATSALSLPLAAAKPTLLVPISKTITFGWTPANSPFSMR